MHEFQNEYFNLNRIKYFTVIVQCNSTGVFEKFNIFLQSRVVHIFKCNMAARESNKIPRTVELK